MKTEAITCTCGCRLLPLDEGGIGWAMDLCPLHGAAENLLEACERLLAHAEHQEVRVSGGCGSCRGIDAIERDGDLPPEITEARSAIAKAKEVR